MQKLKLAELKRLSEQQFKNASKFPVIVVCDNVRSMHNVGSIFRTCDAFRIESLYLCGITATPPHREIYKTALGATETVSWLYFANTVEAIQLLKENNYKIIAIEQTTESIYLQNFTINLNDKFAFILGNEVEGVANDVLALTDGAVEIPQFGSKHSFNVSISAGIVLWHVLYNRIK